MKIRLIKPKTRKEKDGIIKFLFVTLFLMSIVLSIYFSYLFTIGFHNMDLGQNIRVLNTYVGNGSTRFIDIASNGEINTGDQLYTHGVNQIFFAFPLFGICTFLMGVCMKYLLMNRK